MLGFSFVRFFYVLYWGYRGIVRKFGRDNFGGFYVRGLVFCDELVGRLGLDCEEFWKLY